MYTENSLLIRGPIARVYELAAQVENWPQILPHYRRVRVLEPGDPTRVVAMHCVRDFGPVRWPCKWRAAQTLEPAKYQIIYRHVGGITKGMYVEWNLEQEPEGVRTTITHELSYPVPLAGPLFAGGIVGPVFVHNIAGKTLATIKQIVESEART